MLWEGRAGVDGERAWTLVKGGEVGWRVRRDERPLGWERGVPWGAGGLVSSYVPHKGGEEDRGLTTISMIGSFEVVL